MSTPKILPSNRNQDNTAPSPRENKNQLDHHKKIELKVNSNTSRDMQQLDFFESGEKHVSKL